MIKAARAEALIRKVLSKTASGLFQHMMRTINSQVGGEGQISVTAPLPGVLAGWFGFGCMAAAALHAASSIHSPRATTHSTAGAGAAGHAAQRLRGPRPAHHVPAGAVVSHCLVRVACAVDCMLMGWPAGALVSVGQQLVGSGCAARCMGQMGKSRCRLDPRHAVAGQATAPAPNLPTRPSPPTHYTPACPPAATPPWWTA